MTKVAVKTGAVPSSTTRRPGRPRQSEAEVQAVRTRIVAATAQVFAEHGYHGLNVALILKRAGVARPTFYRYFHNADEPLQVLLDESDMALVDGLQAAIAPADSEADMWVYGIDAYLKWASDRGATLRPLFAELHDPSSPVSAHRMRTLALLRAALTARLTGLGRPAPRPIDLDVLLNIFEFVGFRAALADPDDDAAAAAGLAWGRATMARMAMAILGP